MPKQTDDKLKGLETVRDDIRERKAEKENVSNAPLTAKLLILEKHKQMDDALDLACAQEQDLSRTNTPFDVALLFIAAFSDQLKANLARHIEKSASKSAMTPEQKAKRLAELDREILKLEVQEEKLCTGLEAEGVEMVRRGDLSPAVFLECEESDGA